MFTSRWPPQKNGAASFTRMLGSPASTLISEVIHVPEKIEPDPEAKHSPEHSDCTYCYWHLPAILANRPQQWRISETAQRKHAEWREEKEDDQEPAMLRHDVPVMYCQDHEHANQED